MKLKLIRDREHSPKGCVFGRLYINDKPVCWTLEDEERELTDGKKGLTANEKVYAKTAIPVGLYEIRVTFSSRFKRDLPLLVDVPQFSGIRIHPGNTVEDTEGCILVGDVPDFDSRFLGQSRAAFNRIFPMIKAAFVSGDKISIDII